MLLVEYGKNHINCASAHEVKLIPKVSLSNNFIFRKEQFSLQVVHYEPYLNLSTFIKDP